MPEGGGLEWSVFAVLVAVLLAVDIGYAGRGERGERRRWCYVDQVDF